MSSRSPRSPADELQEFFTPSAPGKARVLLVDDDSRVTASMRAGLRKWYTIFTANSGQEALTRLAEDEVHVIISDERMPRMPGSELLALVAHEYPRTVRIILTGQASLESAATAINQGHVFRYLLKPASMDTLTAAIEEAYRHHLMFVEIERLRGIIRDQHNQILGLERRYPGISEVDRDEDGAILIDDEAHPDFDVTG